MVDEKTNMEVEQETRGRSTEGVISRSPRTHVDSSPLPTDSMVTVPLSETDGASTEDEESARESILRPEIMVDEQRMSSRPDSSEIHQAFGHRSSQASVESPTADSPTVSVHDTDAPESPVSPKLSRCGSHGSGKSEQVDWAELEKKEEQEPEGEEEVGLSSC